MPANLPYKRPFLENFGMILKCGNETINMRAKTVNESDNRLKIYKNKEGN